MPRLEKPVDPDRGPVATLAIELRAMRQQAGLSYRALAGRAHYAASVLSQAASGRGVPSWDVVCAYVKACGVVDAEPWRVLWQDALTCPQVQPTLSVEPAPAAGRTGGDLARQSSDDVSERVRARWSRSSNEITAVLLAAASPTDELAVVAARAKSLTGAWVAAIALPDPRGRLVLELVDGPRPGDESLVGADVVFRGGQSLILDQCDDLGSAAIVPLAAGAGVLGVLLVIRMRGAEPFGDEDLEPLQDFATHVALAMCYATARTDQRKLALFENRDRVASEMQELAIRRLSDIRVDLHELGRQSVPMLRPRIGRLVDDLDITVRTIRDLRRNVISLHEGEVATNLCASVWRLITEAADPLGIRRRIALDGNLDSVVPHMVQPDLLAALQAGLSNVTRHAGATEVTVELRAANGTVTLEVLDDGVGIPAVRDVSSGLANLTRRAERWGGTAVTEPRASGGNRLLWTVPLAVGPVRPNVSAGDLSDHLNPETVASFLDGDLPSVAVTHLMECWHCTVNVIAERENLARQQRLRHPRNADTITVFVVDDHAIVRKGLRQLLELEPDIDVIGDASSATMAVTTIPSMRPDVVILDVRLPDGDGVTVCRDLRSAIVPAPACLMLTSYSDDQALFGAILAGAAGYLIKQVSGTEIVAAVRTLAGGGSLLDTGQVATVLNRLRDGQTQDPRYRTLSPQERKTLDLIALGLTNRQIAEQLHLAETTVKNYVSTLLRKLGFDRRAEAAVYAAKLRRDRGEVDGT